MTKIGKMPYLNSEIFYPKEQLLRVSDGEFTFNRVLRCINPVGNTGQLIGRQITGTTSGATAIVENISRFQIGATLVSEFLLNEESITGTFSVGEVVQGTATALLIGSSRWLFVLCSAALSTLKTDTMLFGEAHL